MHEKLTAQWVVYNNLTFSCTSPILLSSKYAILFKSPFAAACGMLNPPSGALGLCDFTAPLPVAAAGCPCASGAVTNRTSSRGSIILSARARVCLQYTSQQLGRSVNGARSVGLVEHVARWLDSVECTAVCVRAQQDLGRSVTGVSSVGLVGHVARLDSVVYRCCLGLGAVLTAELFLRFRQNEKRPVGTL